MIFDEIKASMTEAKTHGEAVEAYHQEHRSNIVAVSAALTKIADKVVRVMANDDCIDLHIAGDRHVLKAIFGAFRRLGYQPDNRPGIKPETSFCTYFRHPAHECTFWVSFSSSHCTRVKVRTETREVDIYETVCE